MVGIRISSDLFFKAKIILRAIMSLPLTLLCSRLLLEAICIYAMVPGLLPSCPWLVHTHTCTHTQSRSWQALALWGETLIFHSEKMTVAIYRLWPTVTLTVVVTEWHWAMVLGAVSGGSSPRWQLSGMKAVLPRRVFVCIPILGCFTISRILA